MARDAFISYSHAADGKFAPKLEAGLQRLTKPWYKIRALEVFRDETNLSLSPHLWDSIVSAMETCEYFLYLASPEAADSKWVGREVEHWLTHNDHEKLLIVVTDGEIAWDESRGDFDWDATNCVPRALAGAFSDEPLYLDMRWAREERDLSLQNPRFKEAVALVSATIQGKAVEDVIGEELLQHRRTRRIRNFAIVTLSVLLVVAASSAYLAVQQRGEAISQRDEAIQRGLLNRVKSELARESLIGAVQAARTGYRRFGLTPLVRESLLAVASDSTAVLNVIRGQRDSAPHLSVPPRGDRLLSVVENAAGTLTATVWDSYRREVAMLPHVYTAGISRDGLRLIVASPSAPALMAKGDVTCGNDLRIGIGDQSGGGGVVSLQAWNLDSPAARDGVDSTPGVLLPDPEDCPVPIWGVCPCGWSGDQPLRNYAPDGSRYLETSGERTALFDRAGTEIAVLEGSAPVFSDDGEHIATVLDGSISATWDTAGRLLGRYAGAAAAMDSGGRLLTVVGVESRLWSPGAGNAIRFQGTGPRFSPDGRWVMTTVEGEGTRIWSVEGQELVRLDGSSGRFSKTQPVVWTATASGSIYLFDLARVPARSSRAAAELWGVQETELDLEATALGLLGEYVSPDGSTRLALGAWGITPGAPLNSEVYRFTRMPAVTKPLEHDQESGWTPAGNIDPECELSWLSFSPPPSTRFVLGCDDGKLWVHDFDGAKLAAWKHEASVTHAVFSREGTFVLSGSEDRTAKLWSTSEPEAVVSFEPHESALVAVLFSADAQQVATVTSYGTLRLWSREGDLQATFSIPDDPIAKARFSSDGKRLVAGTRAGSLRRYFIDPEELLDRFAWVDEPSEGQLRELGLR